MKQTRCWFPILGVILAAGVRHVAAAKEVTLFGQKYTVTIQSRTQVYKNGVKITVQTPGDDVDTKQKANLSFAEGANPASDRLFVVAPIGIDTDGPKGDQFYLLKGTDAAGLFTPTDSEATSFFGGFVDRNRGGRGQTVAWLSDLDTGVKKDKNVALCTFTGADRLHFYDLDTLSGDFENDAVFVFGLGEDDNMPLGSWVAPASGQGGLMVAAAGGGGSWEIGVMDPKTEKFFPVKTDLVAVTADATNKIDHSDFIVHGLAYAGDTEYWILASSGNPGGDMDDALGEQYLYRVKLTFPPNLAAAEPGSIKAEVLGREELISKGLHGSPGGMFGVAVGRALTPGKRVIYLADWVGNLVTLTPIP